MALALTINGGSNAGARFLTWAPSPCVLQITGNTAAQLGGRVRISNRTTAGGGRLVFYLQPTDAPRASLSIQVPTSGSSTVRFFVGGRFGNPSVANGDTSIVIAGATGTPALLVLPVMVRIRKSANALSDGERDRFLAALAQLNNQGAGPFQIFRDMHVTNAQFEAHFDTGFLPWHRAYLLDLERELQAIDPSVALPYWRFDVPAPRLFDPAFVGVSNPAGAVQLSAANPLQFWVTDGVSGIVRRPEFNTATMPATDTTPAPGAGPVLSEAATLALGQASGSRFVNFTTMEGNPHGRAHVSFGGLISSIGTAARDPLFFLLHANVDRLWAKWQWMFHRYDTGNAASFSAGARVGHRLPDTMWPWNGITTPPRPPTAPGGTLVQSPAAVSPGPTPTVSQLFDYQGVVAPNNRLGFGYDDVPFEP
jgi:tyrosinase